MTDYVIDPPATPSVAVADSNARFPVRRIFCVGRNYAAHAREMGKDPDREPPFFFSKPADATVDNNETIAYPALTENLHFEAEMVVAIGKGGVNIDESDALDHVWGYAIGNELTRRDLQLAARDMGRPWDWGKAFDHSAVCGPLHPTSSVGHLQAGKIRLSVNGEIKQDADLNEMIWSVTEQIAILSRSMELKPGDLIYSGTPAGVGPLIAGDVCVVEVEGLGKLTTTISGRI
ncbi:MAG: fumarylpyruvate hydrolase [Planctomycetota bacterium]|jgi:fumarylpyruvate hydrolase